jgi:hypothetical protein
MTLVALSGTFRLLSKLSTDNNTPKAVLLGTITNRLYGV